MLLCRVMQDLVPCKLLCATMKDCKMAILKSASNGLFYCRYLENFMEKESDWLSNKCIFLCFSVISPSIYLCAAVHQIDNVSASLDNKTKILRNPGVNMSIIPLMNLQLSQNQEELERLKKANRHCWNQSTHWRRKKSALSSPPCPPQPGRGNSRSSSRQSEKTNCLKAITQRKSKSIQPCNCWTRKSASSSLKTSRLKKPSKPKL